MSVFRTMGLSKIKSFFFNVMKYTNLMDKILGRGNLNRAYAKVVSNEGVAGVDGMEVDDLQDYMRSHLGELCEALKRGAYTPQPVLGVAIPKDNGGIRQLGIPTVIDRMIQQAIHQVLSRIWEPLFSEYSYGFRPEQD